LLIMRLTSRPHPAPVGPSALRRLCALLTLAWALVSAAGCAPVVGDACETALDCPTPSQATCDLSVPDGYCLLPGCEVNADCPADSVCVRFDRFETYCMLGCGSDGDCRSGQSCRRDIAGSDPFCYVPLPADEAPYTRPSTSSTPDASP
jgi:hypothetical protein